MHSVELSFPDRSEAFSVRGFRVECSISTPFAISLTARSELDDADLDALAGSAAVFTVGTSAVLGDRVLRWTGVCAHAELIHAEPSGLSTYAITLVPRLALLGHRTNCRVFRRLSAPEMAALVLREWGIGPTSRIDAGAYPVLDFRVQYNETDLSFVSRMLEEAGVAYTFECLDQPDGRPRAAVDQPDGRPRAAVDQPDGRPRAAVDQPDGRPRAAVDDRTEIVFTDRPTQGERHGDPLPFMADPSTAAGALHVTRLHRSTQVRAAAQRVRDYDFLHPSFDLHADAAPGPAGERLERYENLPGASLTLTDPRGQTADRAELDRVAQRRLEALRADRKVLSFETNAIDLAPGAIISISGHPRSDIDADTRLLVTQTSLQGTIAGEVHMVVRAVFAAQPFRPPITTPKPWISGVQSATVVGPPEQEIHVDEHGRVRVLFPWDQEGARADGSSCWVRVSQAWAGGGFGVVAHPRVGDEVLIAFLDGDPDEPVIVGRLYNATHIHPWRLPQEKTKMGIRTRTSRGGGGYNELAFEDRAGFESIRLHAHRDLIENVGRDHHATVHQNRVERVHGDASARVEGTRAESIGRSALVAIEGDKTEMIGGTSTLTLDGASLVRAEGDRLEHYQAAFARTIVGAARAEYQGGREERVSGADEARVIGDSSALFAGAREVRVTGPAFFSFGAAAHAAAAGGASFTAGHGADQGRIRISDEGETLVEAPSVTVRAERELTLCVGSSRIVIQGDKITLDAETIEIAATKEVSLTTDGASTVWTDEVVAKAKTITAASTAGASLELGSKAKLDGPAIALGEAAAAEKRAFERRKEELPTAPRTRVTLRDAEGQAISDADYEVTMPGYVDRGTGSSVEVPVFDDVESCVVRWGRPLAARPAGSSQARYEFHSTVFLCTDVPGDAEETARRKLHNLGHQDASLHAAKQAFARSVGVSPEDDGTLGSTIDGEHGG